MALTTEQIQTQLDEMIKARDQMAANLQAQNGAIQLAVEFLRLAQEPTPEPTGDQPNG